MAGEYDINLSNGSVLATLHPLEVNGPDNRSVPRLIQRARPAFQVTAVTSLSNTLSILGDETPTFRVGQIFVLIDTPLNN